MEWNILLMGIGQFVLVIRMHGLNKRMKTLEKDKRI